MKPYFQKDDITIYHGDCLEVMPELKGIDFVYTDPPYNAKKGYGPGKDDLSDEDYLGRMEIAYRNITILSPKWVTHIPKKYMIEFLNFLPKAQLIVVKRGARGGLCRPFFWSDQFDLLYAYGQVKSSPSNLWEGIRLKGEGYFFREETFGHYGYTPRPIAHKAIKYMTNEGDLVLDPFMGTGTTIVEAIESGRRMIGIEYDESSCEITAKRIEKAIRLDRMSFHLDRKERKTLEL